MDADLPSNPQTLILTRADVAGLMRPRDYLAAVERGFLALAEGRASAPPPMHIGFQAGGFHVKGAALRDGGEFAAFKVNGNFPGNPARGLPTIQGAVLLCDGKTGALLAVMDSIEITLRRTAAATALAARFLARADSRRIAMIGCGDQALPQLRALAEILPLESGCVFDLDSAKAERLAQASCGLDLRASKNLVEATADADVIVTCTTAREPFLRPEHVRAGTFIAAVGADAPHKQEIAPELMARTRVFADVTRQAVEMGDLRHAIAAGAMTASGVAGELADLVAERVTGRTGEDEITLFDSTGVAVQDVASALTAFRHAVEKSVGTQLLLGAAPGFAGL